MSRNGMEGIAKSHCAAYQETIERAFPGVRCLEFKVDFAHDGGTNWGVNISGSEDALIRYGLIDPDTLCSLPPCGVGDRGDVKVSRGKTRVRLNGYWRSWEKDENVGEQSRNLEGRILAAIFLSVWSPKSAA